MPAPEQAQRAAQDNCCHLTLRTRHNHIKSGYLGYVIFKNYMTMPVDTLGNTRTIFNKGVEIWKKQEDGAWQNVVDISNADPSINSIE